MSDLNQQLQEIRRQKHIEHRSKTWLPYFFQKYSELLNPKRKAVIRIQRFVKKYLLKDVINNEALLYIQGLFRYRIHITNANLIKPLKEIPVRMVNSELRSQTHHNSVRRIPVELMRSREEHRRLKEEEELKRIIAMSAEESLNKVIAESLNDFYKKDKDNKDDNQEDNQEEEISEYEYALNQAIMASIQKPEINKNVVDEHVDIPKEVATSDEITIDDLEFEELEFNNLEDVQIPDLIPIAEQKPINNIDVWYCIDLQMFGPQLIQNSEQNIPITIFDELYYLSNEQKDKIKKIWTQIDPNTTMGERFQQNMDYQKSLAADIRML